MNSRLIFGLFLTCTPVFAEETVANRYEVVEYTWCNGPQSGPDAADCPSYSAWDGVDLKRLKALELSISSASRLIKIEDSNGQAWQADLQLTCISQPSDQQGCSHKLDFSNPSKITLSLAKWTFFSDQRLLLTIEDQNKLSIVSSDGSFIQLTMKPSPL